ncbi:MAG: hypothetical protein KAH21_04615, partial [Spirochaetaceae bacterium]|nr:hypothetical protein [Spirochaetaceae bacterium]
LKLEYTGIDGKTRILADEGIVLKTSTRQPVPDKPRTLWPIMFIFGTTAGILWRRTKGIFRKVVRILITLSVGLPGLVLGFLMTFTNHTSAYRNINLWPTFPTVLIGVIILLIPVKKKETWLSWIWTVNLAGLVLAVILRISGIYIQDAFAFWALLAPLTLAASRPGLWIEENLLSLRGKYHP